MSTFELHLDKNDELVNLVSKALVPIVTEKVLKSMKEDQLNHRGWTKLKECQEDLFANHTRPWIQDHIIQKFPDVQIENNPQGWIKQVYGRGSVTRIYVPRARKWLDEHFNEIDWASKE